MTRSRCETWSTAKSLAFLAAVFAMTLAVLLPTAAAAARGPGEAVILCSGDQLQVVYVGGHAEKKSDHDQPVQCALCILHAQAALPAGPAPAPAPRIRTPSAQPAPLWAERRLPPSTAPPRPPSTAPPLTV